MSMRSPFTNYYARALEDELYTPPVGPVHVTRFQITQQRNLLFGIESPLVHGDRKYTIEFPTINASLEDVTLSYRGLIAEEIGRAVFTEFVRRKKHVLGHENGAYNRFVGMKREGWIKGDAEAQTQQPFRTSTRFSLQSKGRYNAVVYEGNVLRAEYDGLFQYTLGRHKGIVVFEAKSAGLKDIDPTSKNGLERVQKRIVDPIKELYPNRIIDVVVAAPTESLLRNPFRKRRMREVPKRIQSHLERQSIGVLFMELPLSMAQLRDRAERRAKLNEKHLRGEIDIPRTSHMHWDRTEKGELILVKGRRVEMILAPRGRNGEDYARIF